MLPTHPLAEVFGYPVENFTEQAERHRRERLCPFNNRMAVALNTGFFNTLPPLEEVSSEDADIAWFIYSLDFDARLQRYVLQRARVVYTLFESALLKITRAEAGEETAFLAGLQEKLNRIQAR